VRTFHGCVSFSLLLLRSLDASAADVVGVVAISDHLFVRVATRSDCDTSMFSSSESGSSCDDRYSIFFEIIVIFVDVLNLDGF
jgi:hypothetical protein